MSERAAIILAAGRGTRMLSAKPKVLHDVGGQTLLEWSIGLAGQLKCEEIIVVASPDAPETQALAASIIGENHVVLQNQQLGTAHAVDAARERLSEFNGDAIVLYADSPLIPAAIAERAFDLLSGDKSVVVMGFEANNPAHYGRLITNNIGDLERIVEAKDASREELAVTLCNSGVVAADAGLLFELISQVDNQNAKGEYYLTDIVGLARERNLQAGIVRAKETDFLGVNTRHDLAAAEAAFQDQKRYEMMDKGVTLKAPETVHFSYDTQIANDVIIEEHVHFGPGVSVESNATIHAFSHLEECKVRAGADIGPYARLRPGADIGEGAKIGNFVEVKKTKLGAGAKANHLAYLGDGDIGARANIGAGTIFCNYDGYDKHKTQIGEGTFIGSNSSLVAPVKIGDGAYVGSGSVITKTVSDNALAVARGSQFEKTGWATSFRAKKEKKK